MPYLDFTSALYYLDTYGLTDLVLPFLLIFSVLFAVLEQIELLKDRRFNAVVSLAVALLTVIPHVTGGYPGGYDVVQIINTFLPNALIIIISIFIFLVLVAAVSGKTKIADNAIIGIAAFVAVIALVLVFISSFTPGLPGWLYFLLDPTTQSLVLMLLVAGLVIWWIAGPEKDTSKEQDLPTSLKDFFGNLFG